MRRLAAALLLAAVFALAGCGSSTPAPYAASMVVGVQWASGQSEFAPEMAGVTTAEPIILFVLTKWTGLPAGKHKGEVALHDPTGTLVDAAQAEFESAGPVDHKTADALLAVFSPVDGVYTVVVRVDGRELARYAVTVRMVGPERAPPRS